MVLISNIFYNNGQGIKASWSPPFYPLNSSMTQAACQTVGVVWRRLYTSNFTAYTPNGLGCDQIQLATTRACTIQR